jgi:hypothetical protein
VIYLSGATNQAVERAARWNRGVGLMATPLNATWRRADRFRAWASDNGCFSRGDAFDLDAYLAYLRELPTDGCLFVVAPDVVGDAAATLARSVPAIAAMRDATDAPIAFVLQDGATDELVPWELFDVLFIGGSTEYKLSEDAAGFVREAKRRGKWVHMGRVNSKKRLKYAAEIGCDSADGTFVAFCPSQNLPRMLRWLFDVRVELGQQAAAA